MTNIKDGLLNYIGNNHDYDCTEDELNQKICQLYIDIYTELQRGHVVEVYLAGKPNAKWELYKIGDEAYVDADYRSLPF